MSGPGELERGYRRLLAWYPAGHRRAHEEEMLGVLLAGARSGQRRPGIAESADLIWGALRIRLHPGQGESSDPRWRDALAVVSVVMPLLLLLETAVLLLLAYLSLPHAGFSPLQAGLQLVVQGQLVLAALVLLRLRRVAALVTVAMMIWFAAIVVTASAYNVPELAFYIFFFGLEAAALLASPGPQRGLQFLTWKLSSLLAIAAVAAGIFATYASLPISRAALQVTAIAVIAVIAAGLALASSLGRRILVLLAIPACSFATAVVWPTPDAVTPGSAVLTYLPPLLILCLAIVAVRRSARRVIPRDGGPAT
jgi:hypothetical protein